MSQHEQCLAFCSLQFFSFLPSFFSLTAGDLKRDSWGTSVLCRQLPLLFSTQAARQAPSIAPRYRKKQWLPSRYTAVQKVVLGWPQRASWQWQSNGHSQSDYSGEIQTVLFWVTTLPSAGGLSSLHSLPWVKAQHSALSF